MTRKMEASSLRHASVVVVVAAALVVGCGKNRADPKTAAHREGSRPTEVVHEACNVESAQEKLDANGDGRADISVVMKGGRPQCQAADLNQDGIIDVYAYFESDGKVRRREYAYSRDARINEIRLYRAGQLTEIQQSTVAGGRLDTWHFFKNAKRVRTERDSDGDGIVDEWWEYPHADRPGCPMMYSDADGDAKPDPGSEVDLCEQGYVPPERDEYRYKSPDFQRPGEMPTEVENKEAGEDPSDSRSDGGGNEE
jgi:hypothetical protein